MHRTAMRLAQRNSNQNTTNAWPSSLPARATSPAAAAAVPCAPPPTTRARRSPPSARASSITSSTATRPIIMRCCCPRARPSSSRTPVFCGMRRRRPRNARTPRSPARLSSPCRPTRGSPTRTGSSWRGRSPRSTSWRRAWRCSSTCTRRTRGPRSPSGRTGTRTC